MDGKQCHNTCDNELTTMQIENGVLVKYTGSDAEVIVPDSVEKIGQWAFSDTEDRRQRFKKFIYTEVPRSLEAVCIPSSVKAIGKGAFNRESLLKQVSFSEGLEKIEEQAFAFCNSLSEVRLPDTIRSISNAAFARCETLRRVILPHAVEGDVARKVTSHSCIPSEMFYQCWNLEDAVIPHGTIVIGERAFQGCRSLSEVVIPDTVEEILDNAFDGCNRLQTLVFPASVKRIGLEAIPHGEHSNLESILVSPENQEYCSVDGVLYSKDKKTLISCPVRYERSTFNVPDGVEEIAPGAFDGCEMIKKLLLPDSVKRVGKKAFFRMYHLNKVVLPSHLEEIGDETFAFCIGLRNITWPKDLKKIGCDAFISAGLQKVTIPDGVQEIGDYAFETIRYEKYNSFAPPAGYVNIDEVYLPQSVQNIGLSAFNGVRKIEVFDTIDPNAKPARDFVDDINGSVNGHLGFAGISLKRGYMEAACNSYWSDHVITVRSAEDGTVKCRVRMPDGQKRKVYCTFASSWGRSGEFNFKAIDRIFDELTPDAKLSYAMDRLLCQQDISEEFLEQLIEFLKKRAKRAITRILEGDSLVDLACLARHGIMKKSSASSYIKQANELKADQCEQWLIAWRDNETS